MHLSVVFICPLLTVRARTFHGRSFEIGIDRALGRCRAQAAQPLEAAASTAVRACARPRSTLWQYTVRMRPIVRSILVVASSIYALHMDADDGISSTPVGWTSFIRNRTALPVSSTGQLRVSEMLYQWVNGPHSARHVTPPSARANLTPTPRPAAPCTLRYLYTVSSAPEECTSEGGARGGGDARAADLATGA